MSFDIGYVLDDKDFLVDIVVNSPSITELIDGILEETVVAG